MAVAVASAGWATAGAGPAGDAPAAGDGALEVLALGPRERPCPPVRTSTPFVEGGCRSMAYDFDARLSTRTIAGAIPFGGCIVSFDVSLASDGRVWLDRVSVGGSSPCNDVWACSRMDAPGWADDVRYDPPRASRRPWAGRIDAWDGSTASGSVAACLDTCLGRFSGRLDLELSQRGDSWVMRARKAGLGRSGLAIDGEWELKPGRFEVRRAQGT